MGTSATGKYERRPASGIGGLAALLFAVAGPAAAQDIGTELRGFVHDDAVATIHIRSFFLDRTNPQPPNNAAWAGGGWLGYESGWLFGVLKAGAVGYTSQPLWAPPSTDGTLLLQPGQYGYWVLGQAYGSIKIADQIFTGYRQIIDELEVNPQDDRMTPNTFEAYALRGAIGRVGYFAGYVSKMKQRNDSDFHDMAAVAGAPASVTAGMWLGSVKYRPIDTLTLRASTYLVPDILTSGYGDVAWSAPMPEGIKFRLSSNLMVQGSNGADLLTGTAFSTWSAGGKAALSWGDATISAAYMQTGSAAPYRTPYGAWIGYGKQITKDFDRANERAFQIGAAYDFAGVRLPGLTFSGSATMGNGAIDPTTGASLINNSEYDLDLQYSLTADIWPDCLKPLALRGRAAWIDQNQNGQLSATTEYRLILNYEWKFKSGGR
ncbi:MAG: OprD family outer membrane porin [Reyranellales bacterium]